MKKTNKTFKRFAAITSASLLAACAMAPVAFNAFAAATPITEGSITITTPESDHAYRAYQIFDGDLSKDGDTITFANIKWGSGIQTSISNPAYVSDEDTPGVSPTLSIYDALKNVNNAFSKDVTNPNFDNTKEPSEENPATIKGALTSAEEVSKILETINPNIANGVTTFADIDAIAAVFEQFKDESKTTIVNDAYTEGKYVINITDPGYYLVEETKSGSELASGEAVTKYLLQVAGNAVVNPKADAPKVMKKVYEDSKTTADTVAFNSTTADYQLVAGYNDVADYSIGEDFGFTLYGTLPTSFANYDGYYYQFTDTMGDGISLVDTNNDAMIDENDFIVKIKDGTMTRQLGATEFEYVKTGDGFKIIIPDLKTIDMNTGNGTTFDAVSSSAIITVDYTAELNANAVIGNDGNPNDVYLTYSNNSNTAQGGLNDTNDGPKDETGNTAKDYNVVFTYQLDVTKKLGENDLANAEDGTKAGFRLYNADKSKVATFDNANKFTGWVDSVVKDEYETAGNEIFTTADGTFSFIGIQDGTYYLTETTVPTGYNRMEDKKVVIAADTSNATEGTCQNYYETSGTAVGQALTKLEINVDSINTIGNTSNGNVSMTITNNKGNELPGTGGIGTTIFYLGGGAMAAIGGIYLISKRRMRKSEE